MACRLPANQPGLPTAAPIDSWRWSLLLLWSKLETRKNKIKPDPRQFWTRQAKMEIASSVEASACASRPLLRCRSVGAVSDVSWLLYFSLPSHSHLPLPFKCDLYFNIFPILKTATEVCGRRMWGWVGSRTPSDTRTALVTSLPAPFCSSLSNNEMFSCN